MQSPLVVIVGRPNVGKSTLFNRLIGKQDAIVDDVSGVTRDRNFGKTDWNSKHFRLMDTGGYVPESVNLFETEIRLQVEIAIEQADLILFTVDTRTGVLPIDFDVAKILRHSNKKTLLVVNKVDSEKQELLTSEFFKLGLGEPISVSAISGRRVGDLLDLITEDFPVTGELVESEKPCIAIVGRPNVGKSSLTNALLGYDRSIVTPIPGTTRDKIDAVLKYYGEDIILVDTAGLRKRGKVKESIEYFSGLRTLKAIGESTVTVLLIDAVEGFQNQDQKILDEAISRRKGIIIAVNKWDLIEEKDSESGKKYEKELRDKLGNVDHVPIMFISALTKQRIFKLIELAVAINKERRKKVPTNQLNDILLPIIEQTPPPATPTGKEVKIKYITQGGEYYPMFFFFTNAPKNVHENYRRFLEKAIRKNFGFKGVPFTMVFKEK